MAFCWKHKCIYTSNLADAFIQRLTNEDNRSDQNQQKSDDTQDSVSLKLYTSFFNNKNNNKKQVDSVENNRGC